MKKKNLLKTLGIAAAAGVLIFSAACKNTGTIETPVNQASGTQASTKAAESSISLEKAIEIALAHAGVSRDDASFTKTQLDSTDKVPHYEIDFIADGKEYDYEVAVSSGKILESDVEKADKDDLSANPDKTAAPEVSKGGINVNEPTTEKNGFISVDEAKTKALKDAGVAYSDAIFEKAEFDGDDLIPHYDIEFYADGYEYDYEINAKNYNVIEKSKEKERNAKQPTQSGDFIGADAAMEKALAHAGLKAENATITADLDADDIIPHYEVEIISGKYEYDYEINAKTGAVIAHEKDFND